MTLYLLKRDRNDLQLCPKIVSKALNSQQISSQTKINSPNHQIGVLILLTEKLSRANKSKTICLQKWIKKKTKMTLCLLLKVRNARPCPKIGLKVRNSQQIS